MKLFHLSDLHLGKRVNEFSMLEDQADILAKILRLADEEAPDGILIAGDIYDKSVPSAEAVELLDDFLYRLSLRRTQVFLISGNHDSPERLAFGGRLMNGSGIHFAPVYGGAVTPFSLSDEFGRVDLYLLPFIKPANVRRFFPDQTIESYTDALRAVIGAMQPDPSVRNLLVTHQFVTGALRCESEELSVGGADNVDASVFAPFDYVALGHIHGPQNIGSERIRYCGTPLKYSFSEIRHQKSVSVVELGEKDGLPDGKCRLTLRTLPLTPLRETAALRGRYDELVRRSFYEGTPYPSCYLHITLTDEDDIPDAAAKLRVIYPYLMKLDYDNARTRHQAAEMTGRADVQKSPFQLFAEFYTRQNGREMTDAQRAFCGELIEKIWNEGEEEKDK